MPLHGCATVASRFLYEKPIMFVASARVDKFECSSLIGQKPLVLIGIKFVVFVVVNDSVAHRYRCVVPARGGLYAE